jgi:hypothetical protein
MATAHEGAGGRGWPPVEAARQMGFAIIMEKGTYRCVD